MKSSKIRTSGAPAGPVTKQGGAIGKGKLMNRRKQKQPRGVGPAPVDGEARGK